MEVSWSERGPPGLHAPPSSAVRRVLADAAVDAQQRKDGLCATDATLAPTRRAVAMMSWP